MLDELHKDIEGYEGMYAITKSGKVYSYRTNKYIKTQCSKKDTTLYVQLYGVKKPHYKLFITEKLLNKYFGGN